MLNIYISIMMLLLKIKQILCINQIKIKGDILRIQTGQHLTTCLEILF